MVTDAVSVPSTLTPPQTALPEPGPRPGAYVEVTADHVRVRSDNPRTPGNVYDLHYNPATGRWSCSCPATKPCKHARRMEPPVHITPCLPVRRPQPHGLVQPTTTPPAAPAADAGLPLSSLPLHTTRHARADASDQASDHLTAGEAAICRRCQGRRTAHPSGPCPLCAGKAASSAVSPTTDTAASSLPLAAAPAPATAPARFIPLPDPCPACGRRLPIHGNDPACVSCMLSQDGAVLLRRPLRQRGAA